MNIHDLGHHRVERKDLILASMASDPTRAYSSALTPCKSSLEVGTALGLAQGCIQSRCGTDAHPRPA